MPACLTFYTNHRQLLSLLSCQLPTSTQASAQVCRWSLNFEYVIQFCNTTTHANTDALSRLPLAETIPEGETPPELVLLVNSSSVTADQICAATICDPQLSC